MRANQQALSRSPPPTPTPHLSGAHGATLARTLRCTAARASALPCRRGRRNGTPYSAEAAAAEVAPRLGARFDAPIAACLQRHHWDAVLRVLVVVTQTAMQ